LAELPIFSAGTFPSTHIVNISMTINLTWVENDDPDNDWDPHIMLADGTNMAGVTILDQGGVDLASCVDADVLMDDTDPQRVSYDWMLSTPPLPQVGDSFDIQINWYIRPWATYMEVTHLGVTDWKSSLVNLDAAGALSLVFLSDNQLHEKYQINFIDVHSEFYERLTCNCDEPGLFDPPMDNDVTVKKGNRVIPLKFTLCDKNGLPFTDVISPPMAEVDYYGDAQGVEFEAEDFLTAGQGDDGNLFVFAGDHWQLNLQTKMFSAPGIYTITAVSTDPDSYQIYPACSVNFIIDP
jgi:hypothetical protein